MAYRKATLRRMPPVTREYAKLLDELGSIVRRGKHLVPKVERLERDSQALATARAAGPAAKRLRKQRIELFDSKEV